MGINKAVCNNKGTALSILDTIGETIKSDMQKAALKAVMEWINANNFDDISRLTHEEREARITEILTNLRDCMSVEERREQAAFYLVPCRLRLI